MCILSKKIVIAGFCLFLFLPMLYFFFTIFSENDTAFPKPDFSSISDKSYMKKVEEYGTDHFLGHDALLRLKTNVDVAMGKKELNGVYIAGDRLLEKPELPSNQTINTIIDSINRFYEYSDIPTYVMFLSTATEFYKETLPSYAPVVDEMNFINSTYEKLHSDIVKLDTITPLNTAKAEPIFYQTDRRLTSLGSYMLYSYNSKNMGITSVPLNQFSIEHASDDFYGLLYKKTQYTEIGADSIDLYHYNGRNISMQMTLKNGTETIQTNSIYFKDRLSSSDPTAVFLGGVRPYIQIDTNNQIGRNILIFADDNIGTLTQFLLPHYDSLTIINLNYFTDYYKKYIDLNEYDAVLYFYSLPSLSDSDKFSKLSNFEQAY